MRKRQTGGTTNRGKKADRRVGKQIGRRGRWTSDMSLNGKLRQLLIGFLLPLFFLLVLIMGLFAYYVSKYNEISNNLGISSKFSLEFQSNMDLKMYYYTVKSKSQTELPIEDLDSAVSIAQSLQETTYRKESRKALQHILSYCDNLRRRMYQLAGTEEYDSREEQLEKNIYILTNLIQEEMQNYIYYESGYLALMEQEMNSHIRTAGVGIAAAFIITALVLLQRAFRFSDGISRPIDRICENVKAVGNGNFQIVPVEANDYEIETLDQGIQSMARRIETLLINVKREQESKRLTELQLIQAQVNPHFLYNTLDTIIWLIETGQPDKATEMVSSLSVFFRTSLSKGNDIITLEEEVMHTRSYLDIQRTRYSDILSYEIDIPGEIGKAVLPKLTLQPLVENAIYHGIKNKRGKGFIRVRGGREGGHICLAVQDNGNGMTPEELDRVKASMEGGERVGFGLAAVQERIKLYFGKEYGLCLTSVQGEGTMVEIRIPENIEPQPENIQPQPLG